MLTKHFYNHQKTYQYFLLALLCYFIFLLKLGSFHMRFWDESMFAVNTYEMLNNGNYFSLFFDSQPDLFNTKPPLTNWLQLLSVKAFGYTELAIRLPSALASIVSVFSLFYFLSKNFSTQLAWITILILLTSQGYIGFHTSRTGDSDALLSCFLLLSNLQIFKYLLSNKKVSILWFFTFLAFAALAKLFAALLFIPGIIVILIQSKRLKSSVFTWHFLAGLIGFIAITSITILSRESLNPGYLSIAFGKDAGRLFTVVENHQQSWLYYIDLLFGKHFELYAVLSIIGISMIKWSSNTLKPFLTQIVLLISSYLLIITVSITKLEWYTMPILPLLSVLAATTLHKGLVALKIGEQSLTNFRKSVIIFCIFIYPVIIIFSKSQGNTIAYSDRLLESKEMYLFKAIKDKENLEGLKILHHNWKGSLLFYKYKLLEKGQKIRLETNISDLDVNDKVLVSNDSLIDQLKAVFPRANKIDELYNAKVFLLN